MLVDKIKRADRDTWVQKEEEQWKCRVHKRANYCRALKHLWRDESFIVGQEFLRRGEDRPWWKCDDGYMCYVWIWKYELRVMVRDGQNPWFIGKGPIFVRPQKSPRIQKFNQKKHPILSRHKKDYTFNQGRYRASLFIIFGLVPYDTLHKGTSKRHKIDEKVPIMRCTLFYQYLDF